MSREDWKVVGLIAAIAAVVIMFLVMTANGQADCEARGGSYEYNYIRKMYQCKGADR